MKNAVILFCLLCLVACGGGSSTSVGNGSRTVSGTVTANGVVLSGATVTFGGTSSGTATTGSDGTYSFTGVNNGTYQVTAAKAGYVVTPASLSVSVTNADITSQNFTAIPANYTISGSVTFAGIALEGATVTLNGTSLSGTSSTTATTDANGTYSFSVSDGSYTITAVKTGYVLTPASLAVAVDNADVTGQNFIATSASYTISGTLTSGGAALSGATVTLSGTSAATTTTDTSGNYSFSVQNGSCTVTPTLTGYTFTPATLSPTLSNANATGQDFTATVITYTISGTVTANGAALAGVTVTLSGAATGTATTDASGNYSFTGQLNGSYTVTPTIGGYTIYPASLPVTVSNANVSGKNFTTRFTINGTGAGNGTVTDNTTGLVWMKNANCTETVGGMVMSDGKLTWLPAKVWADGLKDGICGLTDGSSVGNWRVPTIGELIAVSSGTEQVIFGTPRAFSNVLNDYYFSSSSWDTVFATGVTMSIGGDSGFATLIKNNNYYVWPVRNGP